MAAIDVTYTYPPQGAGITVTFASGSAIPVQLITETTPADALTRVQATNSTDATFPTLVPTVTTPVASATRAVLTWAGRDNLMLQFFGTGADNDTFDFRVVGWQAVGSLWVPAVLCQGSVTLSTIVGVAGQGVLATERLADTLSVSTGIGVVTNSPVANALVAWVEVPVGSFSYVEVQFDLTGTSTGANALYNTY